MTADLRTVMWITAVGSAVLFGAIGGLVLLMYVLTSSWLFPKDERAAVRARRRRIQKRHLRRRGRRQTDVIGDIETAAVRDEAEHERRVRAVALAAAIACAETAEAVWLPPITAASDWRLLHRAHGLGLRPLRRRGSA